MLKRNTWQMTKRVSAIFLLCLLLGQENILFRENIAGKDFLYERLPWLMSEILPELEIEKNNVQKEKWITLLLNHMEQELFPAVCYCRENWVDESGFEAEGEEKLEINEKKESTEQEDSSQCDLTDKMGVDREMLDDFSYLMKHFYTVDSTTTITAGELNGVKLAEMDLSISLKGEEPKILIYHTHGSEGFSDSEGSRAEETIIGVGDELTRILEEKYQIKTLHDRTFYDVVNGKLDRSKAYTNAGKNIEKVLKEYPSIEVVIDLHRDAVSEGTRLVTQIEGEETARIMFFNGLSRTAKNGDISYLKNPYQQENLAFSLQMQLAALEKYPDLTRKIYLKGYRYNLHLKPRSLLVEVGAQTNTKEEAKNAMAPLAELLYTVLKK